MVGVGIGDFDLSNNVLIRGNLATSSFSAPLPVDLGSGLGFM